MKIRHFAFVWVFALLISCATGPRAKEWIRFPQSDEALNKGTMPLGQQTYTVEGETYDRVWEVCERSLINQGFLFEKADKASGEIRVIGTSKSELSKEGIYVEPTEKSRLTVSIVRAEENILVKAGLLVAKTDQPSRYDVTRAKNEVDRFLSRLKKELR